MKKTSRPKVTLSLKADMIRSLLPELSVEQLEQVAGQQGKGCLPTTKGGGGTTGGGGW